MGRAGQGWHQGMVGTAANQGDSPYLTGTTPTQLHLSVALPIGDCQFFWMSRQV